MDQHVAEANNFSQRRNLFGNLGVGLMQAVQRLADDLELALDRGLRPGVAYVGLAVQAFGEARDVRGRSIYIRQQDSRVRMHRQVRATRR